MNSSGWRIFAWSLVLLVGACGGSTGPRRSLKASSQAAAQSARRDVRPSILFASPDGPASLDLGYLRSLYSRGIELGWTESLTELDELRLRPFDVLVLFATPETAAMSKGAPPSPEQRETFVALIERFVRSGGGLLLMPEETNLNRQRLADIYERWGAAIPAERIIETDPEHVGALPNTSYVVPLAWTDQIASSPITKHVRTIWYPTHPAFLAATTLPLVVNDQWQVVVRASQTASTQRIQISQSTDAAPGLFQRREAERAPALYAVRSLEAGRIALTSIWPQFSFGAGTKLVYTGTVLERGLRGLPSDFGTLLENTLRWLSAPSLQRRSSSGWVTRVEQLDLGKNRTDAEEFRAGTPEQNLRAPLALSPDQRIYRGVIGARTRSHGKTIAVGEYAKIARREGLDFIVFLDTLEQMNAEDLSALASECARLSGPDLLLLPGLSVRTNVGNHMFLFGPKPVWPPDALLGGEPRTLQIQQEDDGKHVGFATSFGPWLMKHYGHDAPGQVGYYNFSESPGGMRPMDLRLYGALGVRFFRDNRLIEDVTQEYLGTAQGTMPPAPYALHDISSLRAFLRAVRESIGLTYVAAKSLEPSQSEGVLKRALRWSTQYEATFSFVSDGPRVLTFPQTHRIFTFGAEGFSPERSMMNVVLQLQSEAGLDEVALYDGTELFRRFALRGSQTHLQSLLLDGSVQRNLTAVVRDRNGATAISSALRSWAEGSLAPVFCGDRTNDCVRMRLARGPWWLPLADQPTPSTFESGRTWDGGPLAFVSSIGEQRTLPWLVTSEGTKISAERMVSTPALELSDEGSVSVISMRDGRTYESNLLQVLNPWNTFGPIAPERVPLTITQRYRQWQRATKGPIPFVFGANGSFEGIVASLITQTLTFKRPVTISQLGLAQLERVAGARLAVIEDAEAPRTYPLDALLKDAIAIPPRTTFAIFGDGALNANIFVNRGESLSLRADHKRIYVSATPERATFRRNESYQFEIAAHALPQGVLQSAEDIAAYLDYVKVPAGLSISRGERIDSPGVLEVAQVAGAIELSAAQAGEHRFLPARVAGLNHRWSAGLLQAQGYSPGFYGSGGNRYRSLAVDRDGRAYVPLFTALAPYHVIAGHPIVTDSRGGELFLEVTCLGGSPWRWHVAINNPTRRTITTHLTQAMPLPGLNFEGQTIHISAGEYRILL